MDRKIKHRILGVLVVVGLVIILLPLFQGGNEMPTEAKLIKVPVFPDQSVQVASQNSAPATTDTLMQVPEEPQTVANQTPDDTISAMRPDALNETALQDTNSENKPEDTNNQPTPIANIQQTEPTPSVTSENTKQDISNKTTEAEPALSADDEDMQASEPKKAAEKPIKLINTLEDEKLISVARNSKVTVKKAPHISKPMRTQKIRTVLNDKRPLTDNGLMELKNAAWVIQIGSFKNKANALRLVNQLRANGYHAFIQTAYGENTRVFVGPETKHKTARALATKLQTDMNIKGIVISYKPLTL